MTKTEVEAIIFASGKPVSVRALSKVLGGSVEEVQQVVAQLKGEKNVAESGVYLLDHDGSVQFVTNPAL